MHFIGLEAEKLKAKTKWFALGLAILILASGGASLFVTQIGKANKPVIRVACVGDSLTSDTKYPDELENMLGPNYNVVNFGVGRTTVSLEFNKPYMSQSAAQGAQYFEPDIVVIMLGTNDAYLGQQQWNNFSSDYKTLISKFQTLPSNPKIYLTLPPPVFDNTIGLNGTTLDTEIIPKIQQTANDLGLPLIDVHTPLLGQPDGFVDGVHPNSEGSEVIAAQVFDAIT
jgi:alpha-L-fucosidase 2